MNSCEFVSLISGIACIIAKGKSTDELNLLSAVFSQLWDTLATISTLNSNCSDNIDINSNND